MEICCTVAHAYPALRERISTGTVRWMHIFYTVYTVMGRLGRQMISAIYTAKAECDTFSGVSAEKVGLELIRDQRSYTLNVNYD